MDRIVSSASASFRAAALTPRHPSFRTVPGEKSWRGHCRPGSWRRRMAVCSINTGFAITQIPVGSTPCQDFSGLSGGCAAAQSRRNDGYSWIGQFPVPLPLSEWQPSPHAIRHFEPSPVRNPGAGIAGRDRGDDEWLCARSTRASRSHRSRSARRHARISPVCPAAAPPPSPVEMTAIYGSDSFQCLCLFQSGSPRPTPSVISNRPR